MIVALVASSILNVAYLLPLSARAFFSPADEAGLKKQPPALVIIPPVITAAGVIVLFFLIGPMRDYLEPVFMTTANTGGS